MKLSKKLFLLIFIFFYSISYAQGKIYGEIKYTHNTNFFMLYSENYIMKFNDSISFSEETDIEKSNDKTLNSSDDNGLSKNTIVGRKNLTPKYFYNNKTDFYFKDNYFDEILIVKEDNHIWNWEFLNETKKIGKFTCSKATTRFRGRNYTAWYTNEIPLPYGPWKLNGLPGIILEAYDDDEVFHLFASQINIKSNSNTEIDFNTSELENTITVEEYVTKKIELIKADFAMISSKMPKGSKPMIYNENCEDCRDQIEYFNKD